MERKIARKLIRVISKGRAVRHGQLELTPTRMAHNPVKLALEKEWSNHIQPFPQ